MKDLSIASVQQHVFARPSADGTLSRTTSSARTAACYRVLAVQDSLSVLGAANTVMLVATVCLLHAVTCCSHGAVARAPARPFRSLSPGRSPPPTSWALPALAPPRPYSQSSWTVQSSAAASPVLPNGTQPLHIRLPFLARAPFTHSHAPTLGRTEEPLAAASPQQVAQIAVDTAAGESIAAASLSTDEELVATVSTHGVVRLVSATDFAQTGEYRLPAAASVENLRTSVTWKYDSSSFAVNYTAVDESGTPPLRSC